MKLWLLGAAVTGAAEATGVPGWAYMVITLVGGGVGIRYYMARVEKRLKNSEANRTDANTRLVGAQTEEIEERLRKTLMEDVDVAMQRGREETARAQAAEQEALKELAILIASHARDRAEWKEERHTLVNDLRSAHLQIAELEEKVRTMEIRLGYAEGRRDEDTVSGYRLTDLEDRAQRTEDKADLAQENADEQRHRNDDTEGHA